MAQRLGWKCRQHVVVDANHCFTLSRAHRQDWHTLKVDVKCCLVKLFHAPSKNWWEDEEGVVHEIDQGEGGEQIDAMMPLLFSLGQHNALHAVQERLLPNERLFAFLDDVYVVCLPDRVAAIHMLLENVLWVHARIRARRRSTTAQGRGQKRATIWRGLRRQCWKMLECGEEVPTFQRLNVAPVGASNFRPTPIRTPTSSVGPHPCNSGCAVSLGSPVSLRGCQSHVFHRSGAPECASSFSRSHDTALWECLCRVLGVPPDSCEGSARASQLPLAFGGLGLRSAERTSTPDYWASCMIQQRHLPVAATIVEQMANLCLFT